MVLIKTFLQDESGATAIEYGLITALVSLAAIAGLGAVGTELGDLFTFVASVMDNS